MIYKKTFIKDENLKKGKYTQRKYVFVVGLFESKPYDTYEQAEKALYRHLELAKLLSQDK